MTRRRYRYLISGHVQGVWYRASTEQTARALNLTGYARNLDDGRVEVVAEGQHNDLEALRRWCRRGPPRARVDSVEVTEAEPTGEFSEFGVRR